MSHPVRHPSFQTCYVPADRYCKLTMAEEDHLIDRWPAAICFEKGQGPNCHYVVNVGLFFDGTNNNMERDYSKLMDTPEKRCHSNIVRLYLAHPGFEDNDRGDPFQNYRFYMPGVGTPFPQIGETTETTEGKAFAKGGQARILWAILQVYNAVHATVYGGRPMLADDEMSALIRDYTSKVDHGQRPDPDSAPMRRRDWFKPLSDQLSAKLRERLLAKRLPVVAKVALSVFGFSRGAVEARAFCYWYQDLLQDGKFLGAIDTEINFLGLFDSVATVGPSASMNEQFAMWMFSGHSSWAAEILLPLPAIVRKTVHLMAAHEVRMNFPLTRVDGANVEEWLFPGVHSDLGGGYSPGSQGRSRAGHASLLSQIPLVHMYRAALVHGVPFIRFNKLKPVIREDFDVDPEMFSAFNLYLQVMNVEHATDFYTLYCKHMHLYYTWRNRMAGRERGAMSRYATAPQDKQDLEESNDNLLWDLQVLYARDHPEPYDRKVTLSPQQRAGASQTQVVYADAAYPLTSWERWAWNIFRTPPATRQIPQWTEDVLLEHYLHDSLAGFYLAGAITEYDKALDFENMCRAKARGKRLNGFWQRLYQDNQHIADAKISGMQRGDAWSDDDDPPDIRYPLMRDDDAPAMRVALVRLASTTRREGGGYFRQRWVFMPTKGKAENETRHRDPSSR